MWVKTDEGKLVNLDHYVVLQVQRWAGNGYHGVTRVAHWTVEAATVRATITTQLALCDSGEEAQLILDNLYVCIFNGCVKVNTLELREPNIQWEIDHITCAAKTNQYEQKLKERK